MWDALHDYRTSLSFAVVRVIYMQSFCLTSVNTIFVMAAFLSSDLAPLLLKYRCDYFEHIVQRWIVYIMSLNSPTCYFLLVVPQESGRHWFHPMRLGTASALPEKPHFQKFFYCWVHICCPDTYLFSRYHTTDNVICLNSNIIRNCTVIMNCYDGYKDICAMHITGQMWRWGRFSPRTSVSPANLHSICFSTIIFIITRGCHNRPGMAAVPIASQTK
jgi:hypothetical protein